MRNKERCFVQTFTALLLITNLLLISTKNGKKIVTPITN